MGCFDNHGAAMLDSRVWNTQMSKSHVCLQQCDCISVLYDQMSSERRTLPWSLSSDTGFGSRACARAP